MNGETILTMRDIVKCYQMGEEEQMILKHIDFSMCRGEFVSILGPSGSGKSTMMNIIGCLDVPTSGSYILSGQDTSDMDEEELAHISATGRSGSSSSPSSSCPGSTPWKTWSCPWCTPGCPRPSGGGAPKPCWSGWAWKTK